MARLSKGTDSQKRQMDTNEPRCKPWGCVVSFVIVIFAAWLDQLDKHSERVSRFQRRPVTSAGVDQHKAGRNLGRHGWPTNRPNKSDGTQRKMGSGTATTGCDIDLRRGRAGQPFGTGNRWMGSRRRILVYRLPRSVWRSKHTGTVGAVRRSAKPQISAQQRGAGLTDCSNLHRQRWTLYGLRHQLLSRTQTAWYICHQRCGWCWETDLAGNSQ